MELDLSVELSTRTVNDNAAWIGDFVATNITFTVPNKSSHGARTTRIVPMLDGVFRAPFLLQRLTNNGHETFTDAAIRQSPDCLSNADSSWLR